MAAAATPTTATDSLGESFKTVLEAVKTLGTSLDDLIGNPLSKAIEKFDKLKEQFVELAGNVLSKTTQAFGFLGKGIAELGKLLLWIGGGVIAGLAQGFAEVGKVMAALASGGLALAGKMFTWLGQEAASLASGGLALAGKGLALTGQWFAELGKEMAEFAGETVTKVIVAFAELAKSMAAFAATALTKVAGAIFDLGKTIVNFAVAHVGTAITAVLSLSKSLASFAAGAASAAAGAAFGLLTKAIGVVGSAISSTVTTLIAIFPPLGAVIGVLGVVIGAVAVAAVAAAGAVLAVPAAFAGMVAGIVTAIPLMGMALIELGNQMASFVKLASPATVMLFNRAVEDFQAMIGRALTPALEFVTKLIRNAADSMGFLAKIGTTVMRALAPVGGVFEVIFQLAGRMGERLAGVFSALEPAINAFASAMETLFKELEPIGDAIIDSIGGALQQAIKAVLPYAIAFAQILGDWAREIPKLIDQIMAFFGLIDKAEAKPGAAAIAAIAGGAAAGGVPGTDKNSSVGAAAKSATVGSIDEVMKKTMVSAFSLGTDAKADPAVRTASAMEALSAKVNEAREQILLAFGIAEERVRIGVEKVENFAKQMEPVVAKAIEIAVDVAMAVDWVTGRKKDVATAVEKIGDTVSYATSSDFITDSRDLATDGVLSLPGASEVNNAVANTGFGRWVGLKRHARASDPIR